MRKIETNMINAIRNNRSFKSGNTMVTKDSDGMYVSLHGHCIAQLNNYGQWAISLAGWNTMTTRSRVNAIIGAFGSSYIRGVCQRKGLAVMSWAHGKDEVINSNQFYNI